MIFKKMHLFGQNWRGNEMIIEYLLFSIIFIQSFVLWYAFKKINEMHMDCADRLMEQDLRRLKNIQKMVPKLRDIEEDIPVSLMPKQLENDNTFSTKL